MISRKMQSRVQGLATALVLFMAAFAPPVQADPQWSLLLVSPADSITLNFLAQNGFEIFGLQEEGVQVLANQVEKTRLAQQGMQSRVLHEDYGLFLSEQRREPPRLAGAGGIATGSMGGFFSPDEIAAFVDSLIARDTHGIISQRFEYGRSLQDRPLWAVRVSDNASVDEDEPEVLYNALIHSREGATVMVLLNYLAWLVDNYGRVDSVTRLVDSREMYFIPLANPDGYEINWQSYRNSTFTPRRFSLWRKNARDNNGDGVNDGFYDGVDLNRNFDFKWGPEYPGSSSEWTSDSYRGAAAFSEPETRALRDFVNSHGFISAVNFHSYSSILINPWGYVDQLTGDSTLYNRVGAELTRENHYRYGNAKRLLGYFVNGEFTDWQYGDSTHAKIMAWTMEIGDSNDNFWPSVSRTEYLCELNLPFCYSLARLSGFEPRLDSTFVRYVSDDSSEAALGVVLANTGFLTGSGRVRLGLESLDPYIGVSDSFPVLAELALDSSLTVPAEVLRVRFSGKAGSGRVRLVVREGDSCDSQFDITVTRPVARFYDLDGDGRVNIFDLLAFLRRLGNGPAAGEDDTRFDLNDSGRVDIFDLLAFLRKL